MPFVEVSKVAEIRNQLKKALPAFKFSVTREHYTSVNVSILSGPVDFGKPYEQVNQYYIKDNYKDKPAIMQVLLKVNEICSKDEHIEFNDADYGNVPNFYIHISVGKWNKPYQKMN
jgi:hypothetical protein